jgi:hypothetical protein
MTLQLIRLLSVCLVLGALAPGRTQAQSNTGRFEGMDRNSDGRICRAEWRGSEESFRRHDWNNDGVLSGDEVWAGLRLGDVPPHRSEP